MPQQKIEIGPKFHWPPDVEPISIDQLDHLGVGKDNQLYWDGKPVVVRQHLALTTVQKVWAWTAAGVGLFAALGAIAQGWVAGHQWFCQVGWIVSWCPTQ